MHIDNIHEMIEMLSGCAKSKFEKGIESIDTEEMGEVIDMIKDLAEAEYYATITVAMDEAEYGQDYDYRGRMGYRGQPRDSMGRYTSRRGRRMGYEGMYPAEYYRDMDMNSGKMYYSGEYPNMAHYNTSGRASRYGFAYDQYMEKREKHSKSSPEENSKRIELLNDFIEDLEDMAKDVVKGMSPEEKQVWKIKLNKLTSM